MKKIALLIALVLMVSMVPFTGLAAEETVMEFTIDSTNYTINGQTRSMDVAPVIIDDRTLMPIRYVAEGLGATVTWDDLLKIITIEKDRTTLRMVAEGLPARVNNQDVTLDVAPIIINDRTYMPVRFVAENLYAEVGWEQATRKATIRYDGTPKIVMNTYLITNAGDNYTVNVRVPVLTGIEDLAYQAKLNEELYAASIADANAWYAEHIASADAVLPQGNDLAFSYDTSCTMTYNKGGFLSVNAQTYHYTGGAHPSMFAKTYNIDINNQKNSVTYDDLFEASYKAALLNKVNALIQADPDDAQVIGNIDALGRFYLDGDNFVISYDPYEIAPYARGFVNFEIPLSDLADLFKAEYKYLSNMG